ncbi:MAG: hypothetical protein JXQ95_06500 [Alteromonas stellipolaris]|uniref:hypothetical protein n=1 Tax=Alteromonas stellipolaris TaxID=233316 RepID=UPI003B8E9C84
MGFNLKNKALPWVMVAAGIIGVSFGVSQFSIYAEKYTADQITGAFDALTAKYSFLDNHFGNVPHFYKALNQALIKENYSVLELLVLDEKVVVDDSVADYAGLSYPPLPSYIHEHHAQYGAHVAITVGGYPVVAYAQNDDGYMVMTLAQVSKNTVEALEQIIDGMTLLDNEDNKGRLHYRLTAIGFEVSLLSDTPHPL